MDSPAHAAIRVARDDGWVFRIGLGVRLECNRAQFPTRGRLSPRKSPNIVSDSGSLNAEPPSNRSLTRSYDVSEG